MIVHLRIEVTDEQRNALSRHLNPRAEKRLATREDVTAYVLAQAGSLFSGQYQSKGRSEKTAPGPFGEVGFPSHPPETPVDAPPRAIELDSSRPWTAVLASLNNAMWSLATAGRRAADQDSRLASRIDKAREDVVDIRGEVVDRHAAGWR